MELDMDAKQRSDSLPEPEDREARARALYAEFLSENPEVPFGSAHERFHELLREHPELTAELLVIREGHGLLEMLGPDIVQGSRQRKAARWLRERRVPLVGLFLALSVPAAMLVLLWILYGGVTDPEPKDPSGASALQAASLALVDWPLTFPAMSALSPRTQTVVEDVVSRARQHLSGTGDAPPGESQAGLDAEVWTDLEEKPLVPLLGMVLRDRGVDVNAVPSGQLGSLAEELFALTTAPAILDLHVLDLDRRAELTGYEVFAQEVDLATGDPGPPAFLGGSGDQLRLRAGDWRVTVQDPSTRRHAQFRTMVLPRPGRDPPVLSRLVFLRSVSPDEMVRQESCEILYGTSLDLEEVGGTHRADTPMDVDEFWMDPCEASISDYAEFLRDLDSLLIEGLVQAEDDDALPVTHPVVTDPVLVEQWGDHPIANVTWEEARLFCCWMGKRLPSDREWERVAEGDSSAPRTYPWGDELEPVQRRFAPGVEDPFAVFDREDTYTFTTPVTDYPDGAVVSAAGKVYRIADNVSEWVADVALFERGGRLFCPFTQGKYGRVVRGASFLGAKADDIRKHRRQDLLPDRGLSFIGFRAAWSRYPDFERESSATGR